VEGNVGIGTEQPFAKLEITDGDIFISDIESGIIMKSPDGGCWRGTLSNNGTLSFVSITCPGVIIGLKESGEEILKQAVLIYPNPAMDKINIEMNDTYNMVQYSVFNISGKMMISGKTRNQTKAIDISNLERGVYFLEFKDRYDNKIAVHKFIKD
jgi:hypothetical protein